MMRAHDEIGTSKMSTAISMNSLPNEPTTAWHVLPTEAVFKRTGWTALRILLESLQIGESQGL